MGDATDLLAAVALPWLSSEIDMKEAEKLGEKTRMKPNKSSPSLPRLQHLLQERGQGLWLQLVELRAYAVAVLLLLTLTASTNAQLVIQADDYSEPKFTIRCGQLDTAMGTAGRNCGEQFPYVTIEKILLTISGTPRELCNSSKYEMNLELNKMLNYLDVSCPKKPGANDDPYRLPASQYYESYNRHCTQQASLPLTTFAASVNVKCNPQRTSPRPTADNPGGPATPANDQRTSTTSSTSSAPSTPTTMTTTMRTTASTPLSTAKTTAPFIVSSPITEPATTTTTKTTAVPAASTYKAIEPNTVSKSTERSTGTPSADSKDTIGGMSRDLFIILMVLVGLVVLTFLIVVIFMTFRGRRRRLRHDKTSVIYPWLNGGGGGSGEALRLERRDSAYFLGPGKANGSIFAPSTIGDADSLRHIRSPSLTPSLLVPFGADSVVALNVNGENRPFVAVPLDAATRAVGGGGRGSRSSSLSGFDAALDSGSIGSVASAPAAASTTNAPGLSRYRSLFTRRRSLSAPEELDNAAFERDYDAQAPWSGKKGPRPARTATTSSVGRLESIGEELSSIDSAVAARYDADGGDGYANGGSRKAATARRLSQQPPAAGGRRPSRRDKAAASRTVDAATEAEPAFDRPGASAYVRRMTLPDRLGAYGEAAPASYTSPPLPPLQSMLPRYSADGRSFTQDGASFKETGVAEDDDRSDGESSSSVGAPTRWPYSSQLRLPRTSWSGASGGDGGGGAGQPLALPVRKHGWPGRPLARRQSAL